MDKPKLYVVMPAINLWKEFSKACLETIESKYLVKTIVINNASTDETKEEFDKLDKEKFIVVHNDFRNSCSGSWNQGSKIAFDLGADYVCIINNDVLMHKTTLDELVDTFEAQKVLKPEERTVVLASSIDVREETTPETFKDFDPMTKNGLPYQEHPNFSCFMIDRVYWDVIGPFDEEIKPVYFEDNDSHYRVNLAGKKAIHIPTSVFYHFGSKTQTDALGNGQALCTSPAFERNKQYYISKWGGAPGQETYKTPFNK